MNQIIEYIMYFRHSAKIPYDQKCPFSKIVFHLKSAQKFFILESNAANMNITMLRQCLYHWCKPFGKYLFLFQNVHLKEALYVPKNGATCRNSNTICVCGLFSIEPIQKVSRIIIQHNLSSLLLPVPPNNSNNNKNNVQRTQSAYGITVLQSFNGLVPFQLVLMWYSSHAMLHSSR